MASGLVFGNLASCNRDVCWFQELDLWDFVVIDALACGITLGHSVPLWYYDFVVLPASRADFVMPNALVTYDVVVELCPAVDPSGSCGIGFHAGRLDRCDVRCLDAFEWLPNR